MGSKIKGGRVCGVPDMKESDQILDMEKECLQCGMMNSIPAFDITDWNRNDRCLKCDDVLILQHDGSTHTCDIAHNHEKVDQAMSKLHRHLNDAINSYTRRVRFIVGGGRIRDEVLGLLTFYQQQGYIVSYSVEGNNAGAVSVIVRG